MSRPKRLCSYPGCNHVHHVKGWCRAHHYQIVVKGGEPKPIRKYIGPHKCTIKGCNKQAAGVLYCNMHYSRFHKYGDPSIKHKAGAKSQGGHEKYKNHSLMKRNRLIKLAQDPICEFCHAAPSKMVHHKDGSKTNHAVENFLAVCSQMCHLKVHKLIKLQTLLTDLFGNILDQNLKK